MYFVFLHLAARHGLLGGSLNEGVSSICLVVRVLIPDGLVWALCSGVSDLACAM